MKRLNQEGVTFIELMVVLAIIALLFTVTIGVFQGYFNRESFKQSVTLFTNDINSVIHQVKEDVYPSREGIICKNVGGNMEFEVDPTNPLAKPGNSDACIFAGKVVQMGTTGTVSEADDKYVIHNLIALNQDAATSLRFKQLDIQVFNSNTSGHEFDTSKLKPVSQGGYITKVYYDPDGNNDPATGLPLVYLDGIAVVISEFGERSDSDNLSFLGGSRVIALRSVFLDSTKTNETRIRQSQDDFEAKTEAHDATTSAAYYHRVEHPIVVCMESGKGETAFVRIGSETGILEALAVQDSTKTNKFCNF